MKAARYFCARLNSRVQFEDELLTRQVQLGLESGAYTQGHPVEQGSGARGISGLDSRADPRGSPRKIRGRSGRNVPTL